MQELPNICSIWHIGQIYAMCVHMCKQLALSSCLCCHIGPGQPSSLSLFYPSHNLGVVWGIGGGGGGVNQIWSLLSPPVNVRTTIKLKVERPVWISEECEYFSVQIFYLTSASQILVLFFCYLLAVLFLYATRRIFFICSEENFSDGFVLFLVL
jgi:hypothetical protein